MAPFLLTPFAKVGGIVLVVALLIFGANRWLDARDDAAFDRGAKSIEAQVTEANARADQAARALETALTAMSGAISNRSQGQSAALTVKLETLQKDLNREIHADPGARCAVADGVQRTLQDQRSAVNAGIAASNPGQP